MRLILAALALTFVLLPGVAGAQYCTTTQGQPTHCTYGNGGQTIIHPNGRVEIVTPIDQIRQEPVPFWARVHTLKPECHNVDAKGRWSACK